MRIALFLATNFAIIIVLSISLRLLGFEGFLDQQGVNLNINALLLLATVFGMGGSFFSLMISKWMAKKTTGAQLIDTPNNAQEQWLLTTVQRQAKMAGIGMPEVAIIPDHSLNAFATGASKNKALVAVTQGLLDTMSPAEAEAVMAHEISHVANGDMVTMTLIQGVVNTFVIFFSRVIGFLVDRVVFKVERGHGPAFWVTTIIAEVVLGILASIIVMRFSRWREFHADAGGADLAGRDNMIAALETLRRQHKPAVLPDQLAAFGINGGIGQGIKKLFMSHPPLEERIAALQQHNV